ncbi:hypothetical protein HCB39_27545 [Salinispora arenicola]|nr:hypothetical protein [Salinispora arenicola]
MNVMTYNGDSWAGMDPDTNYQLPLWITNVKAAIRDPDVKIHVTLDGLTGSKHCADDTAKAYSCATGKLYDTEKA